MHYTLNTTNDYHQHRLKTLGWELTVGNALEPADSPCRVSLKNKTSFGVQLFNFLSRYIPFEEVINILEVGGGMGYLMRDFLTFAPHLQACMMDISPVLLQKQKEILAGRSVQFREADIFSVFAGDLRPFDLVIMNENLGDFPTLVAERSHPASPDAQTTFWVNKLDDIREEFTLTFADDENINIGALCLLEKLCGARIPYVYLSEHSCEAVMNSRHFPYHRFYASGKPEKIPLQGHTEYTVKFSHLETIARSFGYRVLRGPYADILPIDTNDKVLTAMRSRTPLSDEQEILQQFVQDLYKYEYLVLICDIKKKGGGK